MGSADQQRDQTTLFQYLPVRLAAMHLALPNGPAFQLLKALVLLRLFGTTERMRIKVYPPVENIETQYALMTFSIPVHEIPISSTGTLKTKNHLRWIKVRNAIDTARTMTTASRGGSSNDDIDTRSTFIFHPGVHDVVSIGGNCLFPYVKYCSHFLLLLGVVDFFSYYSFSTKEGIVTTENLGRYWN
jgi:hypothetical protein